MSDQEIRALIIDDSPTDRKLLAYLLSQAFNCQVETAKDGPEGLDKLARGRFAVVFLDMVLPVMDGIAILREIRTRSELAHTPVVVISATGDLASVKSVLGMGVCDYILKPYNKERVVSRLARTFERLRSEGKEGAAGDGLPKG
jgi:DNA-binding response OmpR family regulator